MANSAAQFSGATVAFGTPVGDALTANFSLDGSTADLLYVNTALQSTGQISAANFYTTGAVQAGSMSLTGSLSINTGNTPGVGLVLSDDGDFVDNNDTYGSFRFTGGIKIMNGSKTAGTTTAITLGSNGNISTSATIYAGNYVGAVTATTLLASGMTQAYGGLQVGFGGYGPAGSIALPASAGSGSAGTIFGWNMSAGACESDLVNLQQSGTGGFKFWKNANSTTASLLATIDGSGNISTTATMYAGAFQGPLIGNANTATLASQITLQASSTPGTWYPVIWGAGSGIGGGYPGTTVGGTVSLYQTNTIQVFPASGAFKASIVYNAVWNDIADFVQVEDLPQGPLQFGRVYVRDLQNPEWAHIASSYAAKGILGIASDTLGFGVGKKDDGIPQIPVAIGGFVLAYVDKVYECGTPLTTTKDGGLTKARLLTRLSHPERIIATFDKPEKGLEWNGVAVRGRHWVKVK
jgi:hypothetical protein